MLRASNGTLYKFPITRASFANCNDNGSLHLGQLVMEFGNVLEKGMIRGTVISDRFMKLHWKVGRSICSQHYVLILKRQGTNELRKHEDRGYVCTASERHSLAIHRVY